MILSYYTEEEYLQELQFALSIFDEPDFDDEPDDDEKIYNIVWEN